MVRMPRPHRPMEEPDDGRARPLFASPPRKPLPDSFRLPQPPTRAERIAERMSELPAPASRAALLALTDHDLPTADGIVSLDMTIQEKSITYTLVALRAALRRHPGVYVTGYTVIYGAQEADESDRTTPVWVEPDVLVAFGVGGHDRRSYVIWQEGRPPDFVLEVTSVSTWRRDRDVKPSLYASLGVKEYVLYDVVGGLLDPRLQGHVLRGGAYRAMGLSSLPNGERGLRSEVLGLCAYLRGPEQELRWHDPETGRDLEDHAEVLASCQAAEARARAAEQEAAELRAELRRLRAIQKRSEHRRRSDLAWVPGRATSGARRATWNRPGTRARPGSPPSLFPHHHAPLGRPRP